jgi:hypothetical protein
MQAIITKDMIQAIGNNAVRKAQKKSLENGVANVYSKNGILYFQLPNGEITMNNPFANSIVDINQDDQNIAPNR